MKEQHGLVLEHEEFMGFGELMKSNGLPAYLRPRSIQLALSGTSFVLDVCLPPSSTSSLLLSSLFFE